MTETPSRPRRLVVDGLTMPTMDRKWFEEWREARLGCVNMTVAVWENAHETLNLLARWREVIRANADLVEGAQSVADIRRIAASGRTAIVFGFQNTAPVEHNLDLFGTFRGLGVGVMQLTYNLQNYIGCGYWEEKDTGISSRFGRKAIQEMNDVGILIDLSHCGERTTLEAIELSAKPVAITHANPREFVGSPVYGASRLKTTEALKALAQRGGVLGLTPNRNMTRHGAATTLEQFGDMVCWTVDQLGIAAVALGTDYCPGHPREVRTWWRYARWSRESAPAEQMKVAPHEGWPSWMSTQAGVHNVANELARRGFDSDALDKIMGGNWLRVFEAAFQTATAATTKE
ncbi:MAG TPA: membrane dipeptidase [Ramlibacter sp.]|nr:membrane dipeptidase [Ramlibacter sp.]